MIDYWRNSLQINQSINQSINIDNTNKSKINKQMKMKNSQQYVDLWVEWDGWCDVTTFSFLRALMPFIFSMKLYEMYSSVSDSPVTSCRRQQSTNHNDDGDGDGGGGDNVSRSDSRTSSSSRSNVVRLQISTLKPLWRDWLSGV